MNTQSDHLRDDVVQRARFAASEADLGRVIYEAVHAAQLDWQKVSLEVVKQLLVAAVRVFRQRKRSLPSRVKVTSPLMSIV